MGDFTARILRRPRQALNRLNSPKEGYPIEVVADEDADWQTFKQVNQALLS